MRYRIVAVGFNESGSVRRYLTWADDTNLNIVKEHLKREGYVDVKITEDERLEDIIDDTRMESRRQAEKDLFLQLFYFFGGGSCYEVIDDDGIRKSAIKATHQETLDEDPEGNRERYQVDIDWRLFRRWFGEDVVE